MDNPRWLTAAEQRAWRAFGLVSRLLTDQLERDFASQVGMPATYYELLVVLSEAPKRALRMNELARLTHTKANRISHAVGKLEAVGWVERKHDQTDRRGWLTVLTDKGMAALERAAPIHVESVRANLIDVLDAEQIRQLGEISETLLEHLQASTEVADVNDMSLVGQSSGPSKGGGVSR